MRNSYSKEELIILLDLYEKKYIEIQKDMYDKEIFELDLKKDALDIINEVTYCSTNEKYSVSQLINVIEELAYKVEDLKQDVERLKGKREEDVKYASNYCEIYEI